MKTEQEITNIVNIYEKSNPAICGTDTLISFIKWYDFNFGLDSLNDFKLPESSEYVSKGETYITQPIFDLTTLKDYVPGFDPELISGTLMVRDDVLIRMSKKLKIPIESDGDAQ